jgi:hypothetical protein
MTTVLVCGGRDYANREHVFAMLDALHAKYNFTHLIEGGARGADSFARGWAMKRGLSRYTYYADWNAYGVRAGPIRNSNMLADGRPTLVVAFPGGRGTADMLRKARAAGVEVVEA